MSWWSRRGRSTSARVEPTTPEPVDGPAGSRATTAGNISGIASTGDHATNTQHVTVVSAEALVAPEAVPAPAGLVNLPARLRHFVGRADALGWLDGAAEDPAAVVVQAVHGPAGVGKSALVARWAADRREDHRPVWWITADSPAALDAGLAALAVALQAGLGAVLPSRALREWAVRWLACHDGWLLILDGVTDPGHLTGLLARLPRGRIVLTSRHATGWPDVVTALRLDVLEPRQAVELLTGIVTRGGGVVDPADAVEICAELGCLPSAVAQAGAHLAQSGVTVGDHRRLLAQDAARTRRDGGEPAAPRGRDLSPAPGERRPEPGKRRPEHAASVVETGEPSLLAGEAPPLEDVPGAGESVAPVASATSPSSPADRLPEALRRGLTRRNAIIGAGALGAGALTWKLAGAPGLGGRPERPTPKRRWKASLGLEQLVTLFVRDGLAYVTGASKVSDVLSSAAIVALDPATGAQRWTFPTGDTADSVIVDGGAVYAKVDDGTTTYVHALDAASGQRRWSYQVADATVDLVGVSDGAFRLVVSGEDQRLLSLDAKGKPTPTAQLPPDQNVDFLSHGVLYSSSFGDEDDDVPPLAVATDVTTGRQKWRIEGAGKYIGALRSDGDVTFGYSAVESRHTTLLAWDANTGRQRWSLPLLVDVDPLHLGGGLLYLFTADGRGPAGYLYVVDTAAGTVRWRARAGRAELFSALSVVFADRTVFFAGDAVYAFDVATGARRWRTESLDIRYVSTLLLDSGKLFVTVAPNAKGHPTKLYALDAATGEVVWEHPITAEYRAPNPAVAGPLVLVPNEDGIWAFEA
ncbi:PQQ-binding-like beta-propeller repeat protein [Micromonospora sp. NBRC 101691]|uniref:outer membrane protein assembly factor BamB family protein n=1 Tax=Micromonospora sp. NBRC 101691 TaxID=3032198 RepID=UPI0025548AD1|nr:PQQ-binding-like beta-propeller repeat protein [Micromonospora sp. NBRC 101691]